MARRRRNATPKRGARYAALLEPDDSPSGRRGATGGGGQGGSGAYGRHAAGPYNPSVGTYGYAGTTRRSGLANRAPALIAVLVFAAMAGGGVWFWLHRPINVTVNGTITDVPIGTTVDEARELLGVEVEPGNLVSVGGNVLTAGAGEAYAVSVNDEPQTIDEARERRLQGGERLDFSTGADVFEEYTVEVSETQPKLAFDGEWGSISYVAQWGKVHRQEIRHGLTSGETAEGDVLEQGQDCVVRMTVPQPEGRQLVALTFDDGPSSYTQAYLDILADYGAKATFFNLGTEQESFPEAARAILGSGCEIMSHTNQHLQLTAVGAEEMLSEITTAAATIERVSGVKTTSIRPPYGDFDRQCWLQSQGQVSLSVLWTQDSEDWRRQGVSVIVDNSLAGLANGSIILMHDGGGNRDMDVEALPEIIEAIQASGYELVTISELLAACPDVPADVASGYAPMPADAVWPTELA